METPSVSMHPNEIRAKKTETRFENKYTRSRRDESLEKFAASPKPKGKMERAKSGYGRVQSGFESFSMGAEKVGKRLDRADSYLSNMDFGFDMGGGMGAPRRRSSGKSVPIYRGKRIIGYRKVKGGRRMVRDDTSGDYSLGSIDSGIIGSFDMPRGRKGQSNDFGINWF